MDLLQIIRDNTTDSITKSRLDVLFGQDEPPIIEKSRSGVYANNPENERLHRVGQRYGSAKKEEEPTQKKENQTEPSKQKSNPQVEQKLKKYAKETPTDQLQKFISSTKNEVAKLHAENEMKSRKGELEKKKADLGEWKPIKFTDDFMRENYFLMYEDQVKELDKGETDSLNQYRDNDYFRINKALRSSQDQENKEDQQAVREMDKAFSKCYLKHDLELQRGVNSSKFFEGLSEGEVYEDKGYVSTSLSKKIVNDKFESTTNLIIKARKGQKAIPMQYVGDETNRDMYSDEYEFLLPRSSRFKVQKIDEKDGKRQIFLEML